MVTWGNNTTAVYGTTSPANAPTTPAPAAGGFSFGGGAPSTPPSASQKPTMNPPPLGGSTATGFGAPAPAAGGGFSFGGAPAPPAGGGLFGAAPAGECFEIIL